MNRLADRDGDKVSDRNTGTRRHGDRQTDRQTERQTSEQTSRDGGKVSDRNIGTRRHRHSNRHPEARRTHLGADGQCNNISCQMTTPRGRRPGPLYIASRLNIMPHFKLGRDATAPRSTLP